MLARSTYTMCLGADVSHDVAHREPQIQWAVRCSFHLARTRYWSASIATTAGNDHKHCVALQAFLLRPVQCGASTLGM